MNSMLPDPSLLVSQAKDSQWLEKELNARRLQKEFNGSKTHDQELREAAKGFESIFIQKLWAQMRKTVPKEGYLHSKEEDFYLSMFDKDMAEKLADAGGIGLGDMLYNQLKDSQQDASRVSSPSGAEQKKPIKSLAQEYDPDALQPPEARGDKLNTSLEAAKPNSALSAQDLASLYSPVEGYEEATDVPQGAAEEDNSPMEQAAVAEYLEQHPQAANSRQQPQQQPLVAPDPATSLPKSPQEVARAQHQYAQNTALIQTDPQVLAAVESLAQRIARHKGQVSAQTTATTPPAAPQPSAVNNAAASDIMQPNFQGEAQEVRLLEGGIRRSQAAMENKGGPETAAPQAAVSFEDASPASAPLHWPLDGRQTSGFGWRRDAISGERVFHPGVDLAASEGAPVSSCWGGTVSFAGEKPGYGKTVVIQHAQGWESVYAHNGEISVKEGESVKAGQEIASVGSTGRSTGPHLHFEIRHQGAAFDPVKIHNSLTAGNANSANDQGA